MFQCTPLHFALKVDGSALLSISLQLSLFHVHLYLRWSMLVILSHHQRRIRRRMRPRRVFLLSRCTFVVVTFSCALFYACEKVKSTRERNQVESKCQRLDSNVLITFFAAAVMKTVTSRCNARKVHQITFSIFVSEQATIK
jgi:hypothetical protein